MINIKNIKSNPEIFKEKLLFEKDFYQENIDKNLNLDMKEVHKASIEINNIFFFEILNNFEIQIDDNFISLLKNFLNFYKNKDLDIKNKNFSESLNNEINFLLKIYFDNIDWIEKKNISIKKNKSFLKKKDYNLDRKESKIKFYKNAITKYENLDLRKKLFEKIAKEIFDLNILILEFKTNIDLINVNEKIFHLNDIEKNKNIIKKFSSILNKFKEVENLFNIFIGVNENICHINDSDSIKSCKNFFQIQNNLEYQKNNQLIELISEIELIAIRFQKKCNKFKKKLKIIEAGNFFQNLKNFIEELKFLKLEKSKKDIFYIEEKIIEKNQDEKKNFYIKKNQSKFECFRFFIYPICIISFLIILFSVLILLKIKFSIDLEKNHLFYLYISTFLIAIYFAKSFNKFFDYCDKSKKEIFDQKNKKSFEFLDFLNPIIDYAKNKIF